ncbi:hypothetical protein PG993_009064 [Apiospora rasikravindrae]|uniref:Uncharacterized protein n=1 Tax=Apiospora rasikravindrae TaxID=990691 RepID=A0ABR1SK49_9PEZI
MYGGCHGAGGNRDLPSWHPGMPGFGTNRFQPALNIAGTYNTLPALGMYNPPGPGLNPGEYDSPAYIQPPFAYTEGYAGDPSQYVPRYWGP